MPLRVVYRCKAGCGHETILTEDFANIFRGINHLGTIEGRCPSCGADQFDTEEASTKRQFRPDGLPAGVHAATPR